MEMVIDTRHEAGVSTAPASPRKVLWFSRHRPLPIQVEEMCRLFGDRFEMVEESRPFQDVAEVVRRYREENFDEMVVVLPLSIRMKLVEQGVQPIQSVMENGKFVRFERFLGAEIKSAPL